MKLLVCCSVYVLFLMQRFAESRPQSTRLHWNPPCKSNDDCNYLINATCVDNFCHCGQNWNVCEERHIWKRKRLGENCISNEECSRKNSSVCLDSRCACSESHVAVDFKCLRRAENIGDQCRDDVQCTTVLDSRCSKNKCSCKDGYTERNNYCEENDASSSPRLTTGLKLQSLVTCAILLSLHR